MNIWRLLRVVLLVGGDKRAATHLRADVEPVRLLGGGTTAAPDEPEDTNHDVAESQGTDDRGERDQYAVGSTSVSRDGGIVLSKCPENVTRLGVLRRRRRGLVLPRLRRGPGGRDGAGERVVRVAGLALGGGLALALDAAAVEALLAAKSDVVRDLPGAVSACCRIRWI